MRKIQEVSKVVASGVVHSAKVYRDVEYDEFVVEFYKDSVRQVNAKYFTDDKQDAIDTANVFCEIMP